MDFDFKMFSTRSFERFAQAMAVHVLGQGVLVFGDGPDGAREAAYEGILTAFPSQDDQWTGYTVMQAKFRQVPGTPQEDANWLVAQLREELEKFVAPSSRLRIPDYYLLVTNAQLSPMPAEKRGKTVIQGGIAKIDSVFAEYREKIGFRDYRVWHRDELATRLMSADGLRRSYAAWLSSSDVIADLLDTMHANVAAMRDGMYRYLMRELRAHQPIRLQQAGHTNEAQIMIEDVFVDLPYTGGGQRYDADPDNKRLLASLLARARDRLDGASVKAQQERGAGRPERLLLLGGPGQGKSTLSQFLAQIFRANLLRSERGGHYPADVGRIIERTLEKARAEGLEVDVPKRFPLRVDLPNFADWLAGANGQTTGSLLQYLSGHVGRIADKGVALDDLRDWITRYPMVLILDGLDEVPPSANRGPVLTAIREFWDEAATADLLMVVTTRPQGYNDDLDPSYYTKLEMAPLAPEQAIVYAGKLADARIADLIQRERVIARFRDAAASETTRRLMVSPLQVAILLALIDQRGESPTDRWSLFDKYFAVVLQREQGKSGPVGDTMKRLSRQIAAVHYKAGFLLHGEAETQGGSEASLSVADFRELIKGQLEDEEYEGEELQQVTEALLAASTERLVLLVHRSEGQFSFEVRSLQEFMAAAHLMTGREAIVQKRLGAVAGRAHWLHVFQIAASKCFSANDCEQYRDTILNICLDLNENGEEIDRLLRTGSQLALALLDDGLAHDQPKYRRLLFKTALDVLHVGPDLLPDSLYAHCGREPERAMEHLRGYVASPHNNVADAAWKLILQCASRAEAWTERLLDDIWPDTPEGKARLFKHGVEFPNEPPVYFRMRRSLEETSLLLIDKALLEESDFDENDRRKRHALSAFPCLLPVASFTNIETTIDLKIGGSSTSMGWMMESITASGNLVELYADLPNSEPWALLHALREFHGAPSHTALANLLERLVDEGWKEGFMAIQHFLPWPLATLLLMEGEDGDLRKIATKVRAGMYGQLADWHAAEARWRERGIVDADLQNLRSGTFFDAKVADVGCFSGSGYSLSHAAKSSEWVETFWGYVSQTHGKMRLILGDMLRFIVYIYPPKKTSISIENALLLIDRSERSWVRPTILAAFPETILSEPEVLRRLDQWGRAGRVYLMTDVVVPNKLYEILVDKLGEFPGLLVFLTNLLVAKTLEHRPPLIGELDLSMFTEGDGPVISAYADVLSLVAGRIDCTVISRVLMNAVDKARDPPVAVLAQFLENMRLEASVQSVIAEAIASVVNKNPTLPRRMFLPSIQRIANSRIAELHDPDTWGALDLGDALLALAGSRRKSNDASGATP